MIEVVIAINQLVNTCVWSSYDKKTFGYGFGRADETISARLWRLSSESSYWAFFQGLVDAMFDFFGESDHTYKAWTAELQRRHLPPAYRKFLEDFENEGG
jgi:hypothetical protein